MIKIGAAARRIVLALAMTAGLLAAVGGVASILAPMLVPEAELRRLTFAAIADATGQQTGTGGDAHLVLFPMPHLVVNKVVFPMPGGAALDADRAIVSLRLMPLLIGQLEASEVVLDRATLVVTSSTALSHFAFATLVASPDLPELRLARGTIALRNKDGLTEELISGIEARLDRSSSGRALTYTAAFIWRDVPSQIRLSLADVGAFLAGRPSDTSFDAATASAWLRFRGTSSYGLKPEASGSVSGEAGSLRQLVEWAGLSVPLNGGIEKFSFNGTIAADRSGVSLNPVSTVLDGNRSEGAVHLRLNGGRPALEGTFAADQMDITPYGRLVLTENSAGAWDHRPLDLSALSALDFDLRLSVGKVRAEDHAFEQVATSAVLRSGKLVLALGNARAWGGNVRAALALGPAPDGSGVLMRLQGDANRVALGRALDDLAGIKRLEGTGDIELQLEGRGRSFYNIAQTLKGSVGLSGTGGALLGIDVGQVLRRIEQRPLSGGGDLRGGRTPFDTLNAKLSLKAGVANVETARMDSKLVRLSLSGDVSVPERNLNLKGTAALLAANDKESAALDLPFIIQGAWNSPYVMLDPQSLIRRSGAAQPLLDAVRGKSGGEAAVRSVLDQLTKPTALPPAPAD